MKRSTKHVALDVHQASTVASVREESGRVIARAILPTEEAALVEFFRGMRGSIHVAFEEGTQAQWLENAAKVVKQKMHIPRIHVASIETCGMVAHMDKVTGKLKVWMTSQAPHAHRTVFALVAGLPEQNIQIISPDIGGGFGNKVPVYPGYVVATAASLLLGRPVKWIEDRVEHMLSAIHAREQEHDVELAVSREGEILGLRDRFVVDTGAFNPLGLVIPYNTAAHLMGPYRVRAFTAEARGVLTHKVPTAPYRGAGRPEAVFAVERAIDRAAHALGLEPTQVRERSLIRPEEMPYEAGILYRDGNPLVMDSGDYPEALRRAVALAPFYAAPHYALGRVAEFARKPGDAAQHYRAYLARAPTQDARTTEVRGRLASLEGAPK